jgi:DNA-binding LytR/AlgR family response regulator
MKVIILEDEKRAADHLERLVAKVAPEMEVVARLESVRDSVEYLQNHHDIALIFSDIQLADGLSFAIFNKIKINCPVIFTTAYDNYAIEAFKTNGIDYLLKPIEEERLKQALSKVNRFSPAVLLEKIMALTMKPLAKNFKTRFLVRAGDKIRSIRVEDVISFYSLEKATFLFTTEKQSYCVDFTIDQLEEILDPANFFRINRKYIVAIGACGNMLAWSNSRLRLKIEGINDAEIIVARERVQDFKNWLDR